MDYSRVSRKVETFEGFSSMKPNLWVNGKKSYFQAIRGGVSQHATRHFLRKKGGARRRCVP